MHSCPVAGWEHELDFIFGHDLLWTFWKSVGWILDGQPYTYGTFLSSAGIIFSHLFSGWFFASSYVSPFAKAQNPSLVNFRNFAPFYLASVAGYSLHLGRHEDGLEKIPSLDVH